MSHSKVKLLGVDLDDRSGWRIAFETNGPDG